MSDERESGASAVRPLDPQETAVWRDFLRWSDAVASQVEQALVAATGLSAADFGVLVRVEEVGGTMAQKRLQAELGWTATRLSHQLARMERRMLVVRAAAGAGRSVDVRLTAAGAEVLQRAKVPHARAVRDHFFSRVATPCARGDEP
ncbi:MarR family winged helix-turn-helix transcriptional regulator [Amnibacterium kyonggiense]